MPPDYVETVLAFVDSNWNTSNYDPKPALIDGRDGRYYENGAYTGQRDVDHDLTDNNAVTVTDGPGVDKEPEGLSWEFDRVDAGVTVRVEGVHYEEHGYIDGAGDWQDLTNEVERTLKAERKRPLPDYYHLLTESIDTRSANYTDYYRDDYAATFVGLEQLP